MCCFENMPNNSKNIVVLKRKPIIGFRVFALSRDGVPRGAFKRGKYTLKGLLTKRWFTADRLPTVEHPPKELYTCAGCGNTEYEQLSVKERGRTNRSGFYAFADKDTLDVEQPDGEVVCKVELAGRVVWHFGDPAGYRAEHMRVVRVLKVSRTIFWTAKGVLYAGLKKHPSMISKRELAALRKRVTTPGLA